MERVKLGSIEFGAVTSESIQHDADVTKRPVEKGADISDHIKVQNLSVDINGVVTGDDAAQSLQQLYKYQKDGELLRYVGRSAQSNMVIEGLTTDHGVKISNGFAFSIKLTQVKVTEGKKVAVSVSPKTLSKSKKTNTQTKGVTNKGKQQVKSR